MSFLDRLLGKTEETPPRASPRDVLAANEGRAKPLDSDDQAIQRYRYMIQTAPPETIEEAHAEAFSKLTREQRRKILSELVESSPPAERSSIEATSSDDPRALARVATRSEVRQPGSMERILSNPGMGLGASLLSSFAMGFVGSMVAQSFFSAMGGFGDGAGAQELANSDDETGQSELAEAGSDDLAEGDVDTGDFGDFEV